MRTLALTVFLGACASTAGGRGASSNAPGLCTVSSRPAAAEAGSALGANEAAQTFDSAWTIIARSHWDTTYNGVNWKLVRDTLRPKALAATTRPELRLVLTRMLGTLGQSHFSIIPGELNQGAGAPAGKDQSGSIGVSIRDADPEMLITAVTANGPGALAGLKPGYALVAVNGCALRQRRAFATTPPDIRHLQLERWRETNTLLRGPVGDTVHLTVRDGSGKLVPVAVARRAEPGAITKVGNLPSLSAHLETERRVVGGRNIAILRFNYWMPVLFDSIRAAVDSLRGSDAIVLDLRGNFGGMGVMSAGVAGHFVDSALTLGTMIQRGALQRYIINPQRVNARNERVRPFSGPLAIVVDELSISTTEIFAGGLQALGRARIFGAQSAGQALPSVAEQLPNGDVLYHAIANFLSPTGRPVEGVGVVPDVSAPLSRAALLKGHDPALDAALLWSATFPKSRN